MPIMTDGRVNKLIYLLILPYRYPKGPALEGGRRMNRFPITK